MVSSLPVLDAPAETAALRCHKLALSYRVQWALEDASYRGEPVRRSLAASQTINLNFYTGTAIATNVFVLRARRMR